MSKKVIFVLVDGLGDTGVYDETNGTTLTPLERAHTPTIDSLCSQGLCGLMDPVAPGLACGSDTAHLSILGYDPRLNYHGRGAFESMGAGLEMQTGDVAFKSNFAVVDENEIVTLRRADRRFEEWGVTLCDYLCGQIEDVEVSVKYATEHRCGVRLRGPGLSGSVSGTDPLKDNLRLKTSTALEDTDEARKTARIVNLVSDYFRSKLSAHPLNIERKAQGFPYTNVVLLRGAGHCAAIESFETRHGLKPFMIAPTAIIAGLGITLGFG
jgi:2,3-diphosphopglycerate-independent phosphoglycerate mutase